jgi:thiamine biosynthesis protein ThiS
MRITLNGEAREFERARTVAELLECLRAEGRAVGACAVEVNRTLVPRRSHADQVLADGDAVEIVTLVGGG